MPRGGDLSRCALRAPGLTVSCAGSPRHPITRALQRKRERSEKLGSFDERCRGEFETLRRGLDGVAPDRFPDRLEHHLARPAQQTADDHPLRVDEIAKARDGYAYLVAGIRDCPTAAHVTRDRKLDDPEQGGHLPVHEPDKIDDR